MNQLIAFQNSVIQRVTQNISLSKAKALQLALGITLVMMVGEFVYSYITGSLMLFSDGIHMLSHGASLGVSLLGVYLAGKKSGASYPFGFAKAEILAAFINGISLVIFVGYIVYESVFRLIEPQPIAVTETLVVGALGLLVNLVTAVILSLAGLEDLNTKSAFYHMLADTFSSLAILIGVGIIQLTGWFAIDALLSLVVAIVILKWSVGLLKQSTKVLLGHTPDKFDTEKIKNDTFNKFWMVESVKDLKIWDNGNETCSAMLKVRLFSVNENEMIYFKNKVKQLFKDKYQIEDLVVDFSW